MPQPDQDGVNEKLKGLNAKIEKCDKRLTEIKAALDKANALRDGSKSESKVIVDQLKAIRVRIKAASQEREEIFQQLREMTQARQAQQKNLQDLRKSLKFEDVASVEQRVRELEAKIEMGQCADLKEEKRVMQEIKQLNSTKGMITQYQSQSKTVSEDKDLKEDLERRRAEATGRLDEARKEADKLEKVLEAMRAKSQGDGPNVNELWKEQKELYGEIKAQRAEIRKVNGEFKEEMNKWRDYSRALGNYKRAQGKILYEQRRAEYEAKRAEMAAPIDDDVPTDERFPFVGHPWADEIMMCMDLEKVLKAFMPKEVKEEAKEEAKPDDKPLPEGMKGEIGKKAGNEEEDPFGFGFAAKKKGKKKGGGGPAPPPAPAKVKITLTVDTIGSLSTIGVPIPLTAEDVPNTLATLAAKKKDFEGMTEEDKKAAKAAAPKKGGAKGKGGAEKAASGDVLVAVDIQAPSADKIKVSLSYPALNAAA